MAKWDSPRNSRLVPLWHFLKKLSVSFPHGLAISLPRNLAHEKWKHIHIYELVCECSCVCSLSHFSSIWHCSSPGSSCPWDSLGKNTGVGCHAVLQGIFPTQELNLWLLLCRWILYHWATMWVWMLIAALVITDSNWKQFKRPSGDERISKIYLTIQWQKAKRN